MNKSFSLSTILLIILICLRPPVTIAQDSTITKYPDGTIRSIAIRINGKLDGVQKYYYENGNLNELTTYKNGFEEGKVQAFFVDGTISNDVSVNKYGNLNGEVKRYYRNGNFKEHSFYINGKLNDIQRYYYENGNLSDLITHNNGLEEGKLEMYFENGQLSFSGTNKNGKRHGVFKEYDINGNLKSSEEWVDGNKVE
ncbi:MAG: antitoxin component YwqK of YwqJK toxin-antitoxin module [Ulvibacter sp.]|jgi:antitoxin component YwqK of YwqJK toxin-antitoxin module